MDIRDKIRSGHYEVDQSYPKKENFTEKCDCGCPNCNKIIFDKEKFTVARIKYNDTKLFLMNQFKHDALEKADFQNYMKSEKVFQYAWDKGHSEGLMSVLEILEELSDLFKNFNLI